MLGESWQVPHVPVKDVGTPVTSLMPATPEIVIGFELNTLCPLAMLARAFNREFFQASNKLKISGLNGAPVGLNPKARRKRIVNANEEFLRGKCHWAAGCSAPVQKACPIVDGLCSPQRCLEAHDVLYLRRCGDRTLGVPGSGIHRLMG